MTIQKTSLSFILASLFIFVFIIAALFHLSFPKELNNKLGIQSIRITDRNGIPLRDLLSKQQGRSKWLRLNDINLNVINSLILAEDKRFYSHIGLDLVA